MLARWILLAAGLCIPRTLDAEMVTLQAAKDNTLFENTQGTLSNGSGADMFVGTTAARNSHLRRRALVAFDIGASIPAGATIVSAQLGLDMTKTTAGPKPVSLRRVLADWGEGTSAALGGAGDLATTGDATWVHRFFDTDRWTSPGGDFASTSSAQIQVGTEAAYTWGSTPGMVADVQFWLDNLGSNFGWILIGEEVGQTSAKRFAARENPAAARRPRLFVQYMSTAVAANSWSGIKKLYR